MCSFENLTNFHESWIAGPWRRITWQFLLAKNKPISFQIYSCLYKYTLYPTSFTQEQSFSWKLGQNYCSETIKHWIAKNDVSYTYFRIKIYINIDVVSICKYTVCLSDLSWNKQIAIPFYLFIDFHRGHTCLLLYYSFYSLKYIVLKTKNNFTFGYLLTFASYYVELAKFMDKI